MPRKKPTSAETAPTLPAPPVSEPAFPKPRRARAAKTAAPPVEAPTLDEVLPVEEPKPARSRKKAEPAAEAPSAAPVKTRRGKKAAEPASEEKPKRGGKKNAETAPVVEGKPKAKRPSKARKGAEAPLAEALPFEEPEATPAQVEAPVELPPLEPMTEEPVAPTLPEESPVPDELARGVGGPPASPFDLGDGRELAVTFRPRGVAAARAPRPQPEPVVPEPVASAQASHEGAPTHPPEEGRQTTSDDASLRPSSRRTLSPTGAGKAPIVPVADGEEPLPTFTFRPRSGTAPKGERRSEAREDAGGTPTPQAIREAPREPLVVGDDEMPLISWRPKGSGTPTPETDEDEAPAFEREEREERPRRREREAGTPTSGKMPEPRPVVKPPLAIPPNAPQVVLREGVPVLVRDGQAFPAIAFGGDPDGRRQEDLTFEQVRMAARDGVHLHVLRLPVPVDAGASEETAARAEAILQRAAEADPETQTVLSIDFVPARDADRRFPDAMYRGSGGRPAEPSVCDDAYWGEATKVLEAIIKRLDGNPRLMGLQLDRGWLHPEAEGYDTSKAAVGKFRAWARTRYGNDVVALRAAWFDGSARFETLTGPSADEASRAGDRFIRAGRRERRVVDYHLFLSDVTAARIGELARAVKEASGGCLLVGVEYGPTLEGLHPAGGHLALGKVLRTPEIDFVAGAPSYSGRESGGSAAFPAPVDSFPLNGKLYLSVEDYRTSLGGNLHLQDEPGNPVLKTPQALESFHWRGVGAALAHGMGVAWTDAGGEGSLRSNSVWDRAAKVREALTLRMATPMGDPDVAVFIDERALAYLVDADAFELLVRDVRESILRAGVSAAFYLLSDLAHREKFPDSKLYVFLNAWDIRPETRAAIKTRLQRDGKTLFWVYASSLFDSGRDSLERAREVTGIALKPQPFASKAGTTLLNRRHPLAEAFSERTLSGNAALEPTYFAIPEDATVLGEYTQTGLPSFVVREFGQGGPAAERWTSVFLGEPMVTPALVRALAGMAGAHVWDFTDDVVHVRPPFLTVHCRGTGQRTVALPAKEAAYDLATGQWASVEGANLRFIGVDGATHAFLVGPRAEIEHLLRTNPAQTLKVESLPPRELNVRQDAGDFDVPVMKLGEFIGSAEGDEAADEWFLRPNAEPDEAPATAQAEESPDQVGKRRRRRGGRDRDRDRAPRESSETSAPVANEDAGISVVFRKRT